MSVHWDPDKQAYTVRWREHGRQRAKTFNPARLGGLRAAERAAREFDGKIARAQALGGLADISRGRLTLDEYVDELLDSEWWNGLAESTQDSYTDLLDKRILPYFGGWSLRDIIPGSVEAFIRHLRRKKTGDPTILRALAVLQGIMRRAKVAGHVADNPVRDVDKPAQARTRTPRPVEPIYVERMRAALRAQGEHGDAMLVCLLAYAGPTPEGEALPLTWSCVRRRTLKVPGNLRHKKERTLPIEQPLGDDLSEWRAMCGNQIGSGLVAPFGRRAPGQPGGHVHPDGGPWTGDDWDNWRTRVFRPAAVAAGLPADTRPRDLRGSYATLLIHEGLPVTEVARRLGHSAQTCLKHYASVFEEFDPTERVPAGEAVMRARRAASFPAGSDAERQALAG